LKNASQVSQRNNKLLNNKKQEKKAVKNSKSCCQTKSKTNSQQPPLKVSKSLERLLFVSEQLDCEKAAKFDLGPASYSCGGELCSLAHTSPPEAACGRRDRWMDAAGAEKDPSAVFALCSFLSACVLSFNRISQIKNYGARSPLLN